MEIRELIIIEDPCFYQYTTIKELESFNTSELTIALSVLRKEQRRLKEKCIILDLAIKWIKITLN